jgi:hypothetical protein
MKAPKELLRTALTIAVLTTGAWAQTQTASNASPASSPAATPATTSPDSEIRSELEQLKQLVREQQQRIDALEAGHKEEPVPSATTAPVANPSPVADPVPVVTANRIEASYPQPAIAPQPSAQPAIAPLPSAEPSTTSAPSPQKVSQAQTVQAGSSDERIRNLERQIQGLGPISFSGDVRLRAEPFFGGPANESLDRVRGRVRARFNAFANLGSQFRAGISLASGDINNPISTNQDLTGFYSRKPVALDLAFVEYTPDHFKNLTLVGGKFRYPWYNAELTWDKDLNPEGAAETLGFNIPTPVLKRITLVGFQLPFAQVAGTSSTDQRIAQQITYGGQLQTAWKIAPHVSFTAFSGYYDFRGSDSIALALARASSSNPQTPLVGLLPLTSGNTVPNSTYTTTSTTVITVAGTTYPTGVSSVTSSQFASKFGLFDNLGKLDIDTGKSRLPISFIGDYVQNTEACSNLPNIIPLPANTATATYKQTLNAPCNSHQRRGYWAEARVGRLQEKKDFQFGYTRIYIEREAVLGNFNYSEIRQGTNVTEHRFDAFYQFDKNVQLGFAALIGRPLASSEPWLTRLQFDTIYIF